MARAAKQPTERTRGASSNRSRTRSRNSSSSPPEPDSTDSRSSGIIARLFSSGSRRQAEEHETSPPAQTSAGKTEPSEANGRRSGRSSRRRHRPRSADTTAEPAQQPETPGDTADMPKATRRKSTAKSPRKSTPKSGSANRKKEPAAAGAGAASKSTDPDIEKATPERASTPRSTTSRSRQRTRARKATPEPVEEQTKPVTATHARARVPVTGAPTDQVPEPFAHNAEYELARILDFYGIEWQYEPRSFPLQWEGGNITEAFTPDFYLPDLKLYVELTTLKANLTAEKNRKMRTLRELYPDVNIILLKKRDYLRLLAKYGYGPLSPNQVPDIDRVLITTSKLQQRIGELGAQISKDYAGREPVMVGVLRGVLCFISDLMRNVSVPMAVDLMSISSYEGNGSAAVRILKDLDENIKGRDVILVEDIVDTGMTLNHIIEYLQTKRPASIKVCTLLDKRARRLATVPLEYVGFEIPDEFVVGYGLDFRQRFRNLPFIAVLKHDLLP